MQGDFTTAWSLYLLAAVAAVLLCYRGCRWLRLADTGSVVTLLVAVLLFTPSRLNDTDPNWVPAWMAALLDLVAGDPDRAAARVLTLALVMVAAILLALLIRWRRRSSG